MHLSDYMKDHGLSDKAVAAAIGKDRASVSRYRRKKERPAAETMKTIYEFSQGAVTPNDWFDLGIVPEMNAANVMEAAE